MYTYIHSFIHSHSETIVARITSTGYIKYLKTSSELCGHLHKAKNDL